MAHDVTGRRKPTKPKKQQRAQKRKRDDVNVEKLQEAVDGLDIKESNFTTFADLPLCEPTKAGLKACHFSNLTEIQAKAIPLGLKGADILGAAKTGSGKTLAFLVPVLENLYRQQCIGPDAGLGAMIISPTRELAIQIFDVLYKIGKCGHMFAAGLIIGGKSLKEEQHALARMNIVVCTPGRMLQHLSQTADFSVDGLRMLVLDEADRILDMGFQRDVDAIVEYLPQSRQTLLFSATQTKRVSDLARLSLRDPEYVSVHETAASATPKTLQQNYVLTPLPQKLDTLWSFLQSSKKSKLLVFLSSGKQVRFVYESFRKLQPGIPLLHLHGRQKQTARLEITRRFATAKHSCLLATDVVARGLDFPAVDWVVQVDCPEDADTYIHRVGRTARYERDGRAVLFLDPSEEHGMLERLAAKKVPIERINVRAKKQQSIQNQVQAMCFKDPELKYLGQKAFSSYVRSIHIQKDKDIFNIESYALAEFAASLGLPGAPRIKFLKPDSDASRKAKNAPRREVSDLEVEDVTEEAETDGKSKKNEIRTKYDRMFGRQNQDILSNRYNRMVSTGEITSSDESNTNTIDDAAKNSHFQPSKGLSNIKDDEHAEDELFTVKTRIPALDGADPNSSPTAAPVKPTSNRQIRALKSRKATAKLLGQVPKRLVFDEAGTTAHEPNPFKSENEVFSGQNMEKEREEARRQFVAAERERMATIDVDDAKVAKEKRRNKREKRRQREREMEEGGADGHRGVIDDDYEEDDDLSLPRLENVARPFEELLDLYPDDSHDGVRGSPQRHEENTGNPGRLVKKRRTQPQNLEDLERLATGVLNES